MHNSNAGNNDDTRRSSSSSSIAMVSLSLSQCSAVALVSQEHCSGRVVTWRPRCRGDEQNRLPSRIQSTRGQDASERKQVTVVVVDKRASVARLAGEWSLAYR